MTTIHKNDLLLQSFKGRSPRTIYLDACAALGVHAQEALAEALPGQTDDFARTHSLVCSDFVLGPRGCMAALPVIACSRALRRADLRGCGLTDEFVAQLAEIAIDHPTLRTLDLSDNPFITVYSGRVLVKVVEANANIVGCALAGTHIGDNVARIIARRCEANRARLLSYFADDWFRMKDMFIAMDVDGSGWVHIKNVVGSIAAPILQERMVERIALKRPRKRADNCIGVNAFMELVYINYKTAADIEARLREPGDADPAATATKANWATMVGALRRAGAVCEQLHRLRCRDVVLAPHEADDIVALAVDAQRQSQQRASSNRPPAESGGSAGGPDAPLSLDVRALIGAFRAVFPPLPVAGDAAAGGAAGAGKANGFLRERAEDYISPILRLGSRAMSVTDFRSDTSTPTSGSFGLGGGGAQQHRPSVATVAAALGLENEEDPPRTWRLSPAMLRAVLALFGDITPTAAAAGTRQPTKPPAAASGATSPKQPAAGSGGVMGSLAKREILVSALLDARPATELEFLRVSGLASKFAQHAIPTDVTTLSMQEVVNVLDEYYPLLAVDRPVPLADIEAMVDAGA